MSEHSSKPLRPSQVASRSAPARSPVSAQRWALYAAVAVVVVLAIAWIDGGEEPIHPIEQPVALPTANGSEG